MPMSRCSWSVGGDRSELMIVSTKVMLVERRESMFEAARQLKTCKALYLTTAPGI